MPDNFSNSYMAVCKERSKAITDSMLAELDQMAAEDAAAHTAPKQIPPTAPGTSRESSPGVVSEVLKAGAGGVADTLRGAWNSIDDAATWLDNNFFDLRLGSPSFFTPGGAPEAHKESLQIPKLPEWAQNQTTAGNSSPAPTPP